MKTRKSNKEREREREREREKVSQVFIGLYKQM